MLEAIRNAIEWVASETMGFLASMFPLLMLGLVGLYLLWLVIGYLRVSQVGLETRPPRPVLALSSAAARTPRLESAEEAPRLETRAETAAEEARAEEARPRGTPYCPVDGLAYPAGARYCVACEGDLVLDCSTCGATVNAAATSCYRCGTPTAAASDLAATS